MYAMYIYKGPSKYCKYGHIYRVVERVTPGSPTYTVHINETETRIYSVEVFMFLGKTIPEIMQVLYGE